ncbi:PEP-CTERM sorting domain-containing protein [Noviherbaspirillum suwonense]
MFYTGSPVKYKFTNSNPVSEPTSFALLGLGLLSVAAKRRR